MTTNNTSPPRYMFWHEVAYAIKASNPKKSWDVDHIVAEILRALENCHHVVDKKPPVSVWGVEVEGLRRYVNELKAAAGARTESYVVRGKTRQRRQSSIKPIMMVGIASYPEPEIIDTARRRVWIELVVEAVRNRVKGDGGRLVSVIGHEDEGFFHLHCIADNRGGLVRNLHWGHVASDAEPVKSKKGEVYRKACERIQDWQFSEVGSKMGMLRNRPIGEQAPRMSASQSNRIRQKKLEAEAERLATESQRISARARQLEDEKATALELKARLTLGVQRRGAALDAKAADLQSRASDHDKNTQDLEKVVRLHRAKFAGLEKQWEILERKAEQIRAWEGSIRSRENHLNTLESLVQDHLAWERHRRSGAVSKLTPRWSSNKGAEPDDLDDVPF